MLHEWKYNQKPVSRVMHLLQGAYGFVYLLAFPNGKFYIGQCNFHANWRRYFGSGKLVKRYLKKNGKENIRRYIILLANSKKELDNLEIERIKSVEAVESKHYYNLYPGGEGFPSGKNHPMFGKPSKVYRYGESNPSNKYHGKFLKSLLEESPYKPHTRLDQGLRIIIENPEIEFSDYCDKFSRFGMCKKDSRDVMIMLIKRCQITINLEK